MQKLEGENIAYSVYEKKILAETISHREQGRVKTNKPRKMGMQNLRNQKIVKNEWPGCE